MKQDSFSSRQRMPSEDVMRSIENTLPTIDPARAEGLGQLGILRNAKASSLAREQRLLAIKNSPRDPRIAGAARRFAANERLRRDLAVAREFAETPLPKAGNDSLVVHGFVRRPNRSGIPGLTLALCGPEGNWVHEFGYACTDERGYFLLQPALPPTANPDAALRDAVTSLQLRVFSREGSVVHTEARPVVVRGGSIDFRLIILGDEAAECGCTPPPEKTGGKPARDFPKSPAGPQPTPTRPPSAPAPQDRVGGLKEHPSPPPPPARKRSEPLEAIRGIGPKRADQLRAAGIKDVAAYEQTPGAKLIEVVGYDKTPPPKPATPPAEPAPAPAAASEPTHPKKMETKPAAENKSPSKRSKSAPAAKRTSRKRPKSK